MEFYSFLGNKKIKVDLNSPIDISIPLTFSKKSLNAWGLSLPYKKPVKMGSWVGSVAEGGDLNFNDLYFNPHAHLTHTECVGHIDSNNSSINSKLKNFFFFAKLISVCPEKINGDLIITKKVVSEKIDSIQHPFNSIIIRTLPNDINKKCKDYSNQNPPYFSEECIKYLVEIGINHLLIDLPSVDREKDDGLLKNHKIFFNLSGGGNENTITEFVFISNTIIDADYFLNLQFIPLENDASPSRPVLFKIDYK